MNSKKVFSGFFWRLFERIGVQGTSFILSLIIARLLNPEDYGTIALVTVFISIMRVFIDSGMGNALIQKKNADDLDFSTVFFFNIVIGCILYIVMFLIAPLIAAFYNDSDLDSVMRVLSLLLIISSVRNVQQAYVSKNMLFKKFFFVTLSGSITAAVIGIVMAYKGFGVWALVTQQILEALIGTLVLWLTVKWRPILAFSISRLKSLFSFGWKLLVSSLIDTLYNDLRQLIIGKMYTESELALYNKGKQFPQLIVASINTSIDSVLLPTMSNEQDNILRVKAMTRRAIRTSSYIMAPLMIGLAVCGEPLIELLLTEKWLDCVLFMRVFCVTYIFYPIHTANLNAIKAMGRSDMFLKLEIVKKIVGLSAVLITMWISVEAMAYSLLITTLLSTMINAFPNKKLLNYSWFEQMKDILPNIGLAVLMGVPVFLMQYLSLPTIIILILQVAVGAAIYMGLSVLFKFEMFAYIINMINGFIRRKKSV